MMLSFNIDTISIHTLMDSMVISAIWVWLLTHSVNNIGLRDASASKNLLVLQKKYFLKKYFPFQVVHVVQYILFWDYFGLSPICQIRRTNDFPNGNINHPNGFCSNRDFLFVVNEISKLFSSRYHALMDFTEKLARKKCLSWIIQEKRRLSRTLRLKTAQLEKKATWWHRKVLHTSSQAIALHCCHFSWWGNSHCNIRPLLSKTMGPSK